MTEAITYQQYGGPKVLTLSEAEIPKPDSGQVRVAVKAVKAVKAVSVNLIDVKIRRGDLRDLIPVQLPAIPRFEVSGVVDSVGLGVTGVSAGDEVLGMTDGGAYAESALAILVIPKPPSGELGRGRSAAHGHGGGVPHSGRPGPRSRARHCTSTGSQAAWAVSPRSWRWPGGSPPADTARHGGCRLVSGLGATPVTAGNEWVKGPMTFSPVGPPAHERSPRLTCRAACADVTGCCAQAGCAALPIAAVGVA